MIIFLITFASLLAIASTKRRKCNISHGVFPNFYWVLLHHCMLPFLKPTQQLKNFRILTISSGELRVGETRAQYSLSVYYEMVFSTKSVRNFFMNLQGKKIIFCCCIILTQCVHIVTAKCTKGLWTRWQNNSHSTQILNETSSRFLTQPALYSNWNKPTGIWD